MRIASVLRLAGAAAVAAATVPVASQAQIMVSANIGRAPMEVSSGYYPRRADDLFAGIHITRIQQERLDEVSAEYDYQNPLYNQDELWDMRQVLGPGERMVFDDNVAELRGPYYGPVRSARPWYVPGRIGVRIGMPRTVIVRDGRSRGDVDRGESRDRGDRRAIVRPVYRGSEHDGDRGRSPERSSERGGGRMDNHDRQQHH